MIVDDEPEVVESLSHFLANRGYITSGAFDGKEALSILDKEKIDLVLLDMMMPGISGKEIAKIVRKKYPAVKLIVVTGFPEEGQKLAEEAILEGLFIKPVGINELYVKLLDVLNQRDISALDIKTKQGISARILSIKAKLLFLEPTPEVYNHIKSKFTELSGRGENYELDAAYSTEEAVSKLTDSTPDILIVDSLYLKSIDNNLMAKINSVVQQPKEILFHNLIRNESFDLLEFERLSRAIQAFSFKNGLIDIKWVEI